MLKKAGIVAAAVAATVTATAPLAFAGDYGKDHHGKGGHHASVDRTSVDYDYEYDFDYDLRVDNSRERNQVNRCYFEQDSNRRNSAFLGLVPLLGEQTQALNCTNVGDITVLDLAEDAG